MNRLFLTFSIDTEPDSSGNSWNYRAPLSFQGVYEGILKILTPLFEKYGARPTYLLNNVVLDYANLSGLLSLKNAELGTHLHGDFIATEGIPPDPAGKRGLLNQNMLSPEEESDKMKRITMLFKEKTGRLPLSFRAGRWAAGGNTVKTLSVLGYLADCSVTPGIRWLDETRNVPQDFRFAPRRPYEPSVSDIRRKGHSGILEIPVSIAGYFPFRRQWLRPAWYGVPSLVHVAKRILRQNLFHDTVVMNCMFHNVDVVPDCGPHCATEEKQKFFLTELESLLQFATKQNAEFRTLAELAVLFRKKMQK